ncbi:aldehyde ferredoxin oxidoreductase family protein [Candidatus Bathyarchaeota archaeon]|nr:aldehyde ferredoxin oxidoreductase family protein [Candidatus Bathyarchaeota archaeon]
MPYGYNGKILRVDLTEERLTTEEPPEAWYRAYLGGMGAVAYHLLTENPPGADALSPQNTLVMAPGVISGAPFSGSGRNAVGAKSPLTEGFGEADVGGYWGAELKHAGYDSLIFTGAAEKPVWLWINDGEAEIRDAHGLWGLQIADAEDRMREETGEPQARTALIGPSGENLSRLACVMNDLNHAAGRCGLGAVMGAKNLKGVAVRGHNPPKMADPDRMRELAQAIVARIRVESQGFSDYGTGAGMDAGAATGNLPTRNFRDGSFEEEARMIDAIAVKEKYRVGMGTCYACAVRCKKEVALEEPYLVEARYGGPEYETLGALGSDCGVSDLAAICKANELCQRYGLDTIGAGATIAFAMECYEEGIITPEMTGGLDLSFGNAEAMLTILSMMGRREGLGDILAEGTKRAAESLGGGAEAYAVHVKGQEVPMHEPRLKKALGLGYAVSPTGADHCHNIHDTFMRDTNYAKVAPLGITEKVPIDSLGPGKVRLYKYWMEMRVLANCLSVCSFPPWRFTEYVDLVETVTGWDTTLLELAKVSQRTLTLARLFNVREGFTAADDWLPPRFFSPQTSGALSETAVVPGDLRRAIDTYYGMMGWDAEGVPRTGTLHELGVSWAVEYLPSTETDKLIV